MTTFEFNLGVFSWGNIFFCCHMRPLSATLWSLRNLNPNTLVLYYCIFLVSDCFEIWGQKKPTFLWCIIICTCFVVALYVNLTSLSVKFLQARQIKAFALNFLFCLSSWLKRRWMYFLSWFSLFNSAAVFFVSLLLSLSFLPCNSSPPWTLQASNRMIQAYPK